MQTLEEIRANLTGPGAPFEIVEESVLGETMRVLKNRKPSLRHLLAESAQRGDVEYLVHGDRRITFAEHVGLVASVARGLQERYGVGHGDRVAILAANCTEWVLAYWATVSLGGIVAALNGWWTPNEIRYGVEHSAPKVLIGDRRRLDRVKGDDLGVPILEIEAGFEDLLAQGGVGLPETPIAEDDPAVILYTSGTTGRAKGAVSSHRGVVGFAETAMQMGAERMVYALQRGVKPNPNPQQTCFLATVPFFHLSGLYGQVTMGVATGAKVVLRSGRFDEEDVLRLMQKEQVTSWSALGSTGPRVVSHPALSRYDVSSVTNVGFGGAPTSPSVQRRIRAAFPNAASNLGIGYGLSESVTAVAAFTGKEFEEHPTATGRVLATNEIEIRDPDGKPLPGGGSRKGHP